MNLYSADIKNNRKVNGSFLFTLLVLFTCPSPTPTWLISHGDDSVLSMADSTRALLRECVVDKVHKQLS